MSDFQHWQSSNAEQTAIFGRDLLNIGSTCTHHVHMVPVNNPQATSRWMKTFYHNHKHRSNRPQTSDRYLIFADGGRYGFLIIDLIDDPGGHAIWAPRYKPVRDNWEQIADDFVNLGKCP